MHLLALAHKGLTKQSFVQDLYKSEVRRFVLAKVLAKGFAFLDPPPKGGGKVRG